MQDFVDTKFAPLMNCLLQLLFKSVSERKKSLVLQVREEEFRSNSSRLLWLFYILTHSLQNQRIFWKHLVEEFVSLTEIKKFHLA